MGTRTSYPPGTFCWVDLSTSDRDGARSFYDGLLGWAFDERPGAGGSFSMATVGGDAVAALVDQAPQEVERGIPSHWNNYVSVEDASATVARAAELGAETLGDAFDANGSGRIGVLVDPVGAALCLWQAKEHPGAGRVNEPGCLTWNELGTSETEAAARFYADLFGWSAEAMPTGDGPAYLVVRVGERSNGGVREQSPEEVAAGAPSAWVPYFAVESAEDALAKSTELGGSAIFGPLEMPNGGRIAAIRDPQGAVFSIWEGQLDD